MNKFAQLLTASNKDIKEMRAKMISEDVHDAQSELSRELKKRKRDLEKRLMSLRDMNRDSEFSLKVVKDNFKAEEWVKEIQSIKLELANLEVEIEIAQTTYNEYFGEEA